MAKRGHGEGGIYQAPNGKWSARIQDGYNEKGKPKIKAFYGKTRNEVKTKLDNFILSSKQLPNTNILKMSLTDYITNWLYTYKFNKIKATSFDRLESSIENHIIPGIGHYRLENLTPTVLQKFIDECHGKLGYSSVKKVYDALNSCFKCGINHDDLAKNPLRGVSLQKRNRVDIKPIEILSPEEIYKFEKAATAQHSNGKYIYSMGYGYILMLNTGLRLGEALGLRWKDVDFDNKTCNVSNNVVLIKNRNKKNDTDANSILAIQTTKTTSGERSISLNEKATGALRILKEINGNDSMEYIFSTKTEKVISPRNLQHTFDCILNRAGIEHRGLHCLRHTFASLLFKNGHDVKVVSELLGHADVSTTYNTYIHIVKEQKIKAIEALY